MSASLCWDWPRPRFATLLVGLMPSFGWLLAARALQGLCASIFPRGAVAGDRGIAAAASPARRVADELCVFGGGAGGADYWRRRAACRWPR
ncbi:MAG: hypothetical protein MZV49_15975 [Rhodopseudomonas palustris]|nr:hypothetical protein [Rhodopseudomonas palustris]